MKREDNARQKSIEEQLSNLPFSSRKSRISSTQSPSLRLFSYSNQPKKKSQPKPLRKHFDEGDTSERIYPVLPFSLNNDQYQNDFDTLEAIARYRKAKRPNQDISESEKFEFVTNLKKTDRIRKKKSYFQNHNTEEYDLETHNMRIINQHKHKPQNNYPSFCVPYHDRMKHLYHEDTVKTNEIKLEPEDEFHFRRPRKEHYYGELECDPPKITVIKPLTVPKQTEKLDKISDNEYTPNVHITRRLKAYYSHMNMEPPEFLQNIDPIPLKYDVEVHYAPPTDI